MNRPHAVRRMSAQVDYERCVGTALLNPAGGREIGSATIGIDEIQQSKRNVLGMAAQRSCRNDAGFLRGVGIGGTCPKIAKHGRAAIADDLFSDLVNRREYASDAAGNAVIRDRTVRDREMSLFEKIMALIFQQDVFHPSGWAPPKRGVNQRTDDVQYRGETSLAL